jgi:hypothetical protein
MKLLAKFLRRAERFFVEFTLTGAAVLKGSE